jgi:hypothetical protein
VPNYLVETYLSRGLAGERASRERRPRSAAEQLAEGGTPVRFDRSIYVPEDEICFFVFDAPSGREPRRPAGGARPDPRRRGALVEKGRAMKRKFSLVAVMLLLALAAFVAVTKASPPPG